jgi:peptide/nickel transport system substrate-binding protein
MKVTNSFRRSVRRFAAFTAAGAALVGVLAGCGGSSSSSSSNASSASTGGGKTFVAAVQAIPSSLDAANFNGGTRPFFTLMNSQLFAYNVNSCSTAPSAAALTGVLAKSWSTDPGGKSYTITLNDYKSQYGNPLTSEDVQWSLERGLALSPIVKFLSLDEAHFNPKDPITIL